MWRNRPVRRVRGGGYQLKLGDDERALLRSLPGQLLALLSEGPDDPSLRRLFPPAYGGDHAELEAEYQHYMRDDLLARHREALEVLASTADADTLTDEQLSAWLAALNQLRLVLGTRLDVSEDSAGDIPSPDDPTYPLVSLYHYLSFLQDSVVDALSGSL